MFRTVGQLLRRIAAVSPRDCSGCTSVQFGFVENISPGESVTRFIPVTGNVYCCIGVSGRPDYDSNFSDLVGSEKEVLARIVIAVEHEKQHAMQIVDMFQKTSLDDHGARMLRDYMAYAPNNVMRNVFYSYDMTEVDAGLAGIVNGCEILSGVFGEDYAEKTVCDMYTVSPFAGADAMARMITASSGPFGSVSELKVSVLEHAHMIEAVDVITGISTFNGNSDLVGHVLAHGVPDYCLRTVSAIARLSDYLRPEYRESLPAMKSVFGSAGLPFGVNDVDATLSGFLHGERQVHLDQLGNQAFASTRRQHQLDGMLSRFPLAERLFDRLPEAGWMQHGKEFDTTGGYSL